LFSLVEILYFWSKTWCYNIVKIKKQTHITLDPSKVSRQELCRKNDHFLITNLEKLVFHKNLNVFFLRFPNIHVGNISLINGMPYKSIFNDSSSVLFFGIIWKFTLQWKLFALYCSSLVSLHSFGFSVQTHIRHNPFGTIRSISYNDHHYNILFEDCNDNYEPTCCIKEKLTKKL